MQKIRAFWYVFKNSLINPDYYKGLKTASIWFSLKYLYLLLLITGFVSLLPFVLTAVNFSRKLPLKISEIKKEAESAFPQNLVLTLKNGELSTNLPDPVYYKNWVVIDTDAKAGDYYKFKDKAYFLVTRTEVVYLSNTGNSDSEVVPLKQLQDDGSINYPGYLSTVKSLEPYLDNISNFFWPGLLVFVIIFPIFIAGTTLIWDLISLLFFSFLVYAIIKIMKGNFTYTQIFKFSLHASTLPILFFTFLGLLNLTPTVPFGYSLTLGLFMAAVFQRLWKTNF